MPDDYLPKRLGEIDQVSTWASLARRARRTRAQTKSNRRQVNKPYELSFVGGVKRPAPGLAPEVRTRLETWRTKRSDADDVTYGFLMLQKRLLPEHEKELEALGVKLLQPHPYRCWKSRVPMAAVQRLVELPFVYWFGYADRQQKLDPKLQAGMRLSAGVAEPLRFCINVMDDDSAPDAYEVPRQFDDQTRMFFHSNGRMEKILVAAGFTIVHFDRELNMFAATGTHQAVERILDHDWVHFVEYEPRAKLHLDQSSPLIEADELWDGAYSGAGIRVGIIDTGCEVGNTGHSDLSHVAGCAINYTGTTNAWTDEVGHGTHVAGIAMSRGGCSSGKYRGQAGGVGTGGLTFRLAKCFTATNSFNLNDAMDWMAVAAPCPGFTVPRALVVNNSWGAYGYASAPVGTDATSRKADEQVYSDNIVMVFSAGNGQDRVADPDDTQDYWGAGSICTPGAAKNVLTVGACYDEDQNIVGDRCDFSSQGPTGDSRLKPDVNAPGSDNPTWSANQIWSTGNTSACSMQGRAGTSMAAPHVTGTIATLMHHYSWLQNDPSLVKAWLMARAIPHDNSLTDRNAYGTGRVDAYVAHWNLDSSTGWTGGSIHGRIDNDTWWYSDINVPAGAMRLVIVLAWDEVPGLGGCQHGRQVRSGFVRRSGALQLGTQRRHLCLRLGCQQHRGHPRQQPTERQLPHQGEQLRCARIWAARRRRLLYQPRRHLTQSQFDADFD